MGPGPTIGRVTHYIPREQNEDVRTNMIPSKHINSLADVQIFIRSPAYHRILDLISILTRRVSGCDIPKSVDPSTSTDQHVQTVVDILTQLEQWISEAPPETGPRRFGNVAIRRWHQLLEERVDTLLAPLWQNISQQEHKEELKIYFIGSFGSRQRLDYGTGHELSFLAFIGGLLYTECLAEDVSGPAVLLLFQTYFELQKKLILTYTLEPAGSHGVWGLDDHFHLPYILGSAQLVADGSPSPKPSKSNCPAYSGTVNLSSGVAPKDVLDAHAVSTMKSVNMYFSAIDFVTTVKRGPFFEHSPVLYGVTAVKTWRKVLQGMIKMYRAEVLGKFPVVQHFPVGGDFFPWMPSTLDTIGSSVEGADRLAAS